MRPFVIDCDTGRDDALTLWICDALKLPLVAVVSSYGNVNLEQVIKNNQWVLNQFINLDDVQLFKGLPKPEKNNPFYQDTVIKRQKSVGNGLSDIVLEDSDYPYSNYSGFKKWLVEYTNQNGRIDYVIIGPASNFAKLLNDETINISDYIDRVFMMGGKFERLWNEMPGADFNVGADPYAVNAILQSKLSFYLIPMNVTWAVLDTLTNIHKLKPKSDNGKLAKNIMMAHLEKFSPEPIFRYHDPVLPFAMQAMENDFKVANLVVNLEINNEEFGRLNVNDNACAAYIYEPSDPKIIALGNQIRQSLFE